MILLSSESVHRLEYIMMPNSNLFISGILSKCMNENVYCKAKSLFE